MTEQDTEGRRTYYTGSSSQSNNGEEANFFLFNHRGDTVLVSDQSGSILNELYYEAYGKVTNNTGTPISINSINTSTKLPPLFVGAYGIRYDRKTELSYMRFRWYAQSMSRFINADFIHYLNRYNYTDNNPISRVDSNGLKWLDVVQYPDLVASITVEHYNTQTNSLSGKLTYNLDYQVGYKKEYLKDYENKVKLDVSYRKPAKAIKDVFIRIWFSENCLGFAATGGRGGRLHTTEKNFINIIQSTSYGLKAISNTTRNSGNLIDYIDIMKPGDVVVFGTFNNETHNVDHASHAAIVLYNSNGILAFVERDGNLAVYITSQTGLQRKWGGNFGIYRIDKNNLPTYNFVSGVSKKMDPFENIKADYAEIIQKFDTNKCY